MKDLHFKIFKDDIAELLNENNSVLHQLDFVKAIAKSSNANYEYFVAFKKEKVIAIIVLFPKYLFGKKVSTIPQLYYYQPFDFFLENKKRINENELIKLEVMDLLITYLNKNYLAWNLRLAPETSDIRPFNWHNINIKQSYTYLIDVKKSSDDDYFRKQRTSIKKALSNGFDFYEEFNQNVFMDLIKKSLSRTSYEVNVSDKKHVELLKTLNEKNYIRQFNIRKDNKNVSTWIMIDDKVRKTSYSWQHYTDAEFVSYGISPFMYDSFIKYYQNLDWNSIDLCGANNKSISRIKAAMGGNLKPFYLASKSNSITYSLIKNLKNWKNNLK